MLYGASYGIEMPSWLYIGLGAVMVAAGLFVIIYPKGFLRWGQGRHYKGKEPARSALWAARFVGAAIIMMGVICCFDLIRQA